MGNSKRQFVSHLQYRSWASGAVDLQVYFKTGPLVYVEYLIYLEGEGGSYMTLANMTKQFLCLNNRLLNNRLSGADLGGFVGFERTPLLQDSFHVFFLCYSHQCLSLSKYSKRTLLHKFLDPPLGFCITGSAPIYA